MFKKGEVRKYQGRIVEVAQSDDTGYRFKILCEGGVTAIATVDLADKINVSKVIKAANTSFVHNFSVASGRLTEISLSEDYRVINDAIEDTPEQQMIIRAWRWFNLTNINEGKAADVMVSSATPLVLKGQYNTWLAAEREAFCGTDGEADDEDSRRAAITHLSRGSCACGIYALNEKPTPLYGASSNGPSVLAECILWGWVIPAEFGYRAQHCIIERLWLNLPQTMPLEIVNYYASTLKERYQVPVELLGRQHERFYVSGIAYCPICADNLDFCPFEEDPMEEEESEYTYRIVQ